MVIVPGSDNNVPLRQPPMNFPEGNLAYTITNQSPSRFISFNACTATTHDPKVLFQQLPQIISLILIFLL